jgi:hypothetical protein
MSRHPSSQYRDVLAFLLPAHHVAHVNDLRWKSKKDAALLTDAVQRGFEVFLTNDVRQLEGIFPPARSARGCPHLPPIVWHRAVGRSR